MAGICEKIFDVTPEQVTRCTVGQGNYVYVVQCAGAKYVVRCSEEKDAYRDTVYWLGKLLEIGIPVPRVVASGRFESWQYLVLTYIEGKDIGIVYPDLCAKEKMQIAKSVVEIQNRVAGLEIGNLPADWDWTSFVNEMLDRARERIARNGFFDMEKVERLISAGEEMRDYFSQIKPVPYLDDISTKNLLISEETRTGQPFPVRKVSGIIDVDWIGVGDRLTFVALTYVALLNMECDTDYVEYILKEMKLTEEENKAFVFYALMYCVDFMGERGTRFMDRVVEVNEEIVSRLNAIYDSLWDRWSEMRINMQIIVKRITDTVEKQNICRTVLEALPDWFGIEEAREAYIADSASQILFAALEEEKPVGFLCLKETGKDTVELAVMGVLKERHRHGIGKKLFASAKACVAENGYLFMQVKTVAMGHYEDYDNTNRFYQSLGFKEFEVFPTLWGAANPCQIYVMAVGQ